MAEKLAEVFEQYDIEILSSKKGRGATILETTNGWRILEPFRGSVTRLEQEHVLKKLLVDAGCSNVDTIILNEDGQLLTYDRYRQPFVMRQHFDGRECDMHECDDLVRGVELLARFHLCGKSLLDDFDKAWNVALQEKERKRIEEIRTAIENGEELEKLSSLYEISEDALKRAMIPSDDESDEPILLNDVSANYKEKLLANNVEDLFIRHNKEMKKIRRYIYTVKRKNSFENLYSKVFESFYEKGKQCVSLLKTMPCERKDDTSTCMNAHYGICHGSYNQHNIILGDQIDAIVHFEKFSKGNQLNDLYQFSRKVMEKNHFDFVLLDLIFDTYSRIIPLSTADYEYMYILFSYPEKFWKIANSYYNSNKAFLSPKFVEKLNTVIVQETEKEMLLANYREKNKLFI